MSDLIGETAAARQFGVSWNLLYRARKRGVGPPYVERNGTGSGTSKYYYKCSDVEAWLSKRADIDHLANGFTNDPDWVSRPKASRYLKISVRMLERLMRNGDVQYEKSGPHRTSRVFFRREELDRIKADHPELLRDRRY